MIKILSKRHLASIRQAENTNIMGVLNNNQELKDIIESFCVHSGGTKSTHSILNYLREKFGPETIKFSDKVLNDYIEDCKNKYKVQYTNDQVEVGKVGLEADNIPEDGVADYFRNGK